MAGFVIIEREERTFRPSAGGWSPRRSGDADSVTASDSTENIELHQLTGRDVVNTAYEMSAPRVTFLIRSVDGERWASWGSEHATGDDTGTASLALWSQLGEYLESLESDEASLAPELRKDLTDLRAIIRRR